MNLKKNKRGNAVGILIFIAALFLLLIVGFITSAGTAIVNYVANETVPELTNLGTTGGVNLTQIADKTIVPVNNTFQNVGWLIGVLYVMCLFGCIGFAVYSRMNPDKWLLGFFFVLMLLLILGSIVISNMYEDFYNDSNDFVPFLEAQPIMSFMIINAPLIFTIIGFITGIIIFSGISREVTA